MFILLFIMPKSWLYIVLLGEEEEKSKRSCMFLNFWKPNLHLLAKQMPV